MHDPTPKPACRYDQITSGFTAIAYPVDVVVVSRTVFEEWKDIPGTVFYDVVKEGVSYGIAA